jgi:hypothetical protein
MQVMGRTSLEQTSKPLPLTHRMTGASVGQQRAAGAENGSQMRTSLTPGQQNNQYTQEYLRQLEVSRAYSGKPKQTAGAKSGGRTNRTAGQGSMFPTGNPQPGCVFSVACFSFSFEY